MTDRNDQERRDHLVRTWSCPKHDGCWTADHLPTAEVIMQAMNCAETCGCWRHWVTDQPGLGASAWR